MEKIREYIPLKIIDDRVILNATLRIHGQHCGLVNIVFIVDTGSPDSFIGTTDMLIKGIKPGKKLYYDKIAGGKYTIYEVKNVDMYVRNQNNKTIKLKIGDFKGAEPTPSKESAKMGSKWQVPSIIGMDFLLKHKLSLFVAAHVNKAYLERKS